MKTFIKGLLVLLGFTNSIVSADLLGDADDVYVGFQMAMPIELNQNNLSLIKAEYSFLLVEQTDGIREGLSWSKGIDNRQTFGYLYPSNTFMIESGMVSDHAIPLIMNQKNGGFAINRVNVIGGAEILMYAVGGAIFVGHLIDDLLDDGKLDDDKTESD